MVRDLLDAKQLEIFREGCSRRLAELLSVPGPNGQKYMCESTRLPHRYSYGTCSASRQLLHDMAWASQIDLPTTTPILKRLFGSDDYVCHGAGGDLCLPGVVEYQHLHRVRRSLPSSLFFRYFAKLTFRIFAHRMATRSARCPA